MRILHLIASTGLLVPAACLLGGCHKPEPFTPGNHTPVNEAAMPSPDLSSTDALTTGTGTPSPAPAPGTPPPSLVPSPVPPGILPSPGT
jgi:hypothetical protein